MQHDTRQPAPGQRTARRPIAILSYHQTTRPPARGTPVRSLVLPPRRLARQLWSLRLLGWRGLSLRELAPYLSGEKTGKVFGITLDDGYLNNYEEALPVLREVGFTATAFIVSSQIGGSNVWDHAKGAPPTPLMGLGHLRGWLDAGMEIGAHTRNHANLCDCDADTARDEIAGSKHALEQALGIAVRSFSYPYGEHRPEHAQMVREAGYTLATTIVSSRARPEDDPALLPRISVHLHDRLPRLLAQVTTDYEDWRMRRPKNRAQPTSRWYEPASTGVAAAGIGSGATTS